MLVGLPKHAPSGDSAKVRRGGFVLIIIATLLAILPLSATTCQAVAGAADKNTAMAVSRQWLDSSSY